MTGTQNTGLIIFGSENHNENNSDTPQGGGIELTRKILVRNLELTSKVSFVSLDNSNNQIYRIDGINNNKFRVTEDVQINGIIPSISETSFIRIDKISKISGGPIINEIIVYDEFGNFIEYFNSTDSGTEVTELLSLMSKIDSNPFTSLTYFEKFFFKNLDDIDIILELYEIHDEDEDIEFAIDTSIDSSSSSLNRISEPTGLIFDSLPKTITINSGQSIGMWVRVPFDAGELVSSKSYSIKVVNNGSDNIINIIQPYANSNELSELMTLRNSSPKGGGNPINWVELGGAKLVELLAFEPDPSTFRDQFYYNTRLNQLFKRLSTSPVPVWKATR